jgi:hypothetical protein
MLRDLIVRNIHHCAILEKLLDTDNLQALSSRLIDPNSEVKEQAIDLFVIIAQLGKKFVTKLEALGIDGKVLKLLTESSLTTPVCDFASSKLMKILSLVMSDKMFTLHSMALISVISKTLQDRPIDAKVALNILEMVIRSEELCRELDRGGFRDALLSISEETTDISAKLFLLCSIFTVRASDADAGALSSIESVTIIGKMVRESTIVLTSEGDPLSSAVARHITNKGETVYVLASIQVSVYSIL